MRNRTVRRRALGRRRRFTTKELGSAQRVSVRVSMSGWWRSSRSAHMQAGGGGRKTLTVRITDSQSEDRLIERREPCVQPRAGFELRRNDPEVGFTACCCGHVRGLVVRCHCGLWRFRLFHSHLVRLPLPTVPLRCKCVFASSSRTRSARGGVRVRPRVRPGRGAEPRMDGRGACTGFLI
jgi:hypothetical protein